MKLTNNKKIGLSLFCILLVIFEFNLVIFNIKGEDISGFSTYYNQNPIQNQTVYYNFDNSIRFGISTNVSVNGKIEFDSAIANRDTLIIIGNEQPATINFTSKTDIDGFDFQKKPKGPSEANFQYKYQFNYIIQIKANISITNITIQYQKVQRYGLNPNGNYKIARFRKGNESWDLLSTEEKINESTGEPYLETQIYDLDANNEDYITIFQVTRLSYDWIWIIVIIAVVSIAGLAILLSKKEYIQFLKTRTVPVDKGAHQLSMEDVLDNENRNKIIDLILDKPGIHFNELLRETNLSAGNLAWHLDILGTYKVIGKKRIGRYLVYFPYYEKNPISNIDLKLQKSELTLEILEMIEIQPGTYNNQIAKQLNLDHKTVSYHINKLKDLGLIHSEKSGRKKKLYPNLEAEYFNNHNNNNNDKE